jgi:hypothetical protein
MLGTAIRTREQSVFAVGAIGRMERSTVLLSSSMRPSSMKVTCFAEYPASNKAALVGRVRTSDHNGNGLRRGAAGRRGEAQRAVGFTNLGFSQFGGLHPRARRQQHCDQH